MMFELTKEERKRYMSDHLFNKAMTQGDINGLTKCESMSILCMWLLDIKNDMDADNLNRLMSSARPAIMQTRDFT